MAGVRVVRTVAAGGVDEDALVSQPRYQHASFPTKVRIYGAVNASAGISEGEVTVDVSFGNVSVADNFSVPVLAVANTGPNRNEHRLIAEGADAGDRITIRTRNSDAAAAAEVIYLIDLEPVVAV